MRLHYVLSSILIMVLTIFVYVQSGKLLATKNLVSPVLGISKDQISINAWTPLWNKKLEGSFSDAPEITAQSAFFIDTDTGEVLYAKNPDQPLSIASLTKIMTTIIALENKSLDDVYTISFRASEMEPDKMLLQPNEKLTLEELLDGIFLVSANDAAEAIAEGTVNNREEFIRLMNSKAYQLGMNNTLLVNPTGLEEDPIYCNGRVPCSYSTAVDVAIMSRYLIKKWPNIINISSQQHIYLQKSSFHQDYDLYSGINLLTTYPGVVGLKTGFTPEAGLTLVTLARQNNKEVLGVLLGAVNRRDDAKLMLDYSFLKLNN